MELSELIRKITSMQTAAKGRLTGQSNDKTQTYIQGYCDGLDGVMGSIRKAIEAEKIRQRLARLESELAQDAEPDWSQIPESVTLSTTSTRNSVAKATPPDSSTPS